MAACTNPTPEATPTPATPYSVLIGSAGGTVSGPNNSSAVIPPGALDTAVRIALASPDPAEVERVLDGLLLPEQFSPIGSVQLDLGQVTLQKPLKLSIPNVAKLDSDAVVLVVLLPDGGGDAVELVEIAAASGDRVETASPPYPGIAQSGRYAFLRAQAPLAFVQGTVQNQAGSPAARAAVVDMNLPGLLARTNLEGRFVAGVLATGREARLLATGPGGRVGVVGLPPVRPVPPAKPLELPEPVKPDKTPAQILKEALSCKDAELSARQAAAEQLKSLIANSNPDEWLTAEPSGPITLSATSDVLFRQVLEGYGFRPGTQRFLVKLDKIDGDLLDHFPIAKNIKEKSSSAEPSGIKVSILKLVPTKITVIGKPFLFEAEPKDFLVLGNAHQVPGGEAFYFDVTAVKKGNGKVGSVNITISIEAEVGWSIGAEGIELNCPDIANLSKS